MLKVRSKGCFGQGMHFHAEVFLLALLPGIRSRGNDYMALRVRPAVAAYFAPVDIMSLRSIPSARCPRENKLFFITYCAFSHTNPIVEMVIALQ